MSRCLVLMLVAACGRIGFDDLESEVCVAIGHDEDADGVDDACDVCPQLADVAQVDRDGDRVGDACDPHPDDPRDQIAVFDPFTSQRPAWTFPAEPPMFTGDAMVGDGRQGQFRADLTGAPGTDTYTFVVNLGEASPTGQRQLALYALEDNAHVYYCDHDQIGASNVWAQSFTTNGTDFDASDMSDATGPLEQGRLVLTLQHDADRWACETTWPVVTPRLESAIPAGISPRGISIGVLRLQLEITSFLHVHSN